ncbi:MAG: LuxR C-terminal-related transcriptional regulator [Thermomicrobiales bacterium]
MTAAGEPRYTMLETVRAFGLERLAESGEMEAARAAQAKALLAVALRRFRFKPGGQVQDEGRHPWLTAEQANVRATLTWLAETGNAEDALRLTAALSFSWHFQMTLRESQQWFEWVLANTPDRPSNARSLALGGLAMTMWAQGDLERAQQLATQALAIGERLDDEVAIADAVDTLGNIALTRHDYERAKPLMERAVSLWRHLGRPAAEASALQILAGIEHGLGEEDAALLHAQDALARFRLLQSPPGMAGSLARLARQVRDQGYDRTAALTYREQLVICFKWNDRFSIVQAFAGLGEIGGRHGQPEIAALLIGAIDAIAAAAGSKRLPTAGVNYDRATATARTALGEQEFASLRAAGRGLSVERAVSLAWQVNVPAAVPGEPAAPWLEPEVASGLPTATGFSHVPSDNRSASPVDLNLMLSQPEATPDLTYRERDVLGLLCQRWTDQEIATHLFISPRTVSSHVSNILAKLGAANRREAAAIAARSGLLQG